MLMMANVTFLRTWCGHFLCIILGAIEPNNEIVDSHWLREIIEK